MYEQLKEFGKLKANEPLYKHTTFKIGGNARFLLMLDAIDDAVKALQYMDGEGISYMMLGGGSNMLASDEEFDGVVVQIKAKHMIIHDSVDEERVVVEVEAGCPTVEVARKTMAAGIAGFEWGVGVPGSMGGAVRGNAGAMGSDMKASVAEVDVYRDGEVVRLSGKDCAFGYRESLFKHNSDVVLRVWLRLTKGEDLETRKKAIECLQYRTKTQPQGFPSTGCIFKNVVFQELDELSETLQADLLPIFKERKIISAGWLVDQAGMKEGQVGQAQVSERHGNFIINLGGATAEDVKKLIAQIKQAVYDKYEVMLEEEVAII